MGNLSISHIAILVVTIGLAWACLKTLHRYRWRSVILFAVAVGGLIVSRVAYWPELIDFCCISVALVFFVAGIIAVATNPHTKTKEVKW